jgi:hypothetical protein
MASSALENPQAITGQTTQGWFKPKWYKPLGQLFELLSVIVLVCLLGLLWLPLQPEQIGFIVAIDLLVVFGLFGAAVFCLRRAICEAQAEAEKAERIASSRNHVISDARLLVLKEEKVARDAFEVLRRLNDSRLSFADDHWPTTSKDATLEYQPKERILKGEELIAELQKGLGAERTEEVKNVILKYTVKDEEPSSISPTSSNPTPSTIPPESAAAATVPDS